MITVPFNPLKGWTWKFGEQQQKGKSKLWEIKVVLGGWDEHRLEQKNGSFYQQPKRQA